MTDVIVSAPDVAPTKKNPSQPAEPSPSEDIHPNSDEYQRGHHLIGRLRVVLTDLGFCGVISGGWASPTSCGLSFGDLTQRQADYLIRALEDLAVDQAPDLAGPGPDQLPLFEVGR